MLYQKFVFKLKMFLPCRCLLFSCRVPISDSIFVLALHSRLSLFLHDICNSSYAERMLSNSHSSCNMDTTRIDAFSAVQARQNVVKWSNTKAFKNRKSLARFLSGYLRTAKQVDEEGGVNARTRETLSGQMLLTFIIFHSGGHCHCSFPNHVFFFQNFAKIVIKYPYT